MSTTICASCGQDLLPSLEMCFDCELGNPAPPASPRATRRYRFDGEAQDQTRLAAALGALCPAASKGDVDWLAHQRDFDVVADVTAGQDRRLAELLRACAPQVVAFSETPPSSTSLRLSFGGYVREKFVASAVIGGVTAAFGVPLVPAAAVIMCGVLLARAPRLVERRLTLARAQADAFLGALDEAVLAEARLARMAIKSPALLDVLRACLGHAAQISSDIRESGAHVTVTERRRADSDMTQLTRALLKLAVAANRLASPDDAIASRSQPYRAQTRPYEAALQQLRALASRLDALRGPAAQMRASDPQGASLAALLGGIKQLSHLCVQALGSPA